MPSRRKKPSTSKSPTLLATTAAARVADASADAVRAAVAAGRLKVAFLVDVGGGNAPLRVFDPVEVSRWARERRQARERHRRMYPIPGE